MLYRIDRSIINYVTEKHLQENVIMGKINFNQAANASLDYAWTTVQNSVVGTVGGAVIGLVVPAIDPGIELCTVPQSDYEVKKCFLPTASDQMVISAYIIACASFTSALVEPLSQALNNVVGKSLKNTKISSVDEDTRKMVLDASRNVTKIAISVILTQALCSAVFVPISYSQAFLGYVVPRIIPQVWNELSFTEYA